MDKWHTYSHEVVIGDMVTWVVHHMVLTCVKDMLSNQWVPEALIGWLEQLGCTGSYSPYSQRGKACSSALQGTEI